MTTWQIRRGDHEFSAQHTEQLQVWAKHGRILPGDELNSGSGWKPAVQVPELRGYLPQPYSSKAVACSTCGFVGERRQYGTMQVVLLVLLALLLLIPAIIYALMLDSWVKRCPQCDNKGLIPLSSLRGQELQARAMSTGEQDVTSGVASSPNPHQKPVAND